MDFGASVSMIVSPDYLLDNSDFNLRDLIPEKRKQPKRAAKTPKTGRASKSKRGAGRTKETAKTPGKDGGDSLPRKIIIHKGNKFYCDSQSDRKLIWKCSTSRFTNCTAQLTTNLNCNRIIEAGTHDHADNTE